MNKKNWFREFYENSTSPSVNYFVMKHRSLLEKIYWILTYTFMILITFISLGNLINVWMNNPTVMFIENTKSSIQEIPFPLITVCPSNQLRKSVWEKYKNTNSSYWDSLQHYQSLICSSHYYASKLNHEVEYFDYDLIKQLVNDCAVSCSEVFQSEIKWQNTTITNICHYVQPIMSIVGLCFTINMMPSYQLFTNEIHQKYIDFFSKHNSYNATEKSKWNLDDGYSSYSKNNISVNINPVRMSGVSYYQRLRIILHTLDDEFVSCPNRPWKDGWVLVSLANPSEYYALSTRTLVASETYKKIQITPFVKKAESDLKWRSAEARKCYLHNEKKLTLFQLYTMDNCYNECRIKATISMCGCVNFESVFLVANGVKVCGTMKKDCLHEAYRKTHSSSMKNECNCWPTCSLLEYQITDTSHYDNWTYLRTTNLVKNNSIGSTVELLFKDSYFTAYKTASIVDLNSLISSIGGILSLFLGLHLINFFEIFYVLIQMISYYIVHFF